MAGSGSAILSAEATQQSARLHHGAFCAIFWAANLTDNGITDDGIKHFAGLKNLTQLKLERTLVTDEGVTQLRKVLPDTNISH